ncbi:MAG: tRNA pseudouridine(55) synthase TruB [Rickettsiales bacterium]
MRNNKNTKNLNGWISIDKPVGISSAKAVAEVKKILNPKKIGHAGTLDPLACGVLPLALGEATKTINYMMDADKIYEFTVNWGEEKTTDDAEGEVVKSSDIRPKKSDITELLPRFTGNIRQTPPDYSAIKINGKRACDLLRNGQDIELKERIVNIYHIDIQEHNNKSTRFICECGKGTYIRSIARDIGRIIGCYGYVSYLCRISVGKFDKNNAISLEKLGDMVHKGSVDFLRPVESALDDILAWDVNSTQAEFLRNGQSISVPSFMGREVSADGNTILFARNDGVPVAICKYEAGVMKPVRVFNL